MRRLVVVPMASVVLLLGWSATAQAAPPGAEPPRDEAAQAPAGGGKPKQQAGDCAGGIPGIEQLCDALRWDPLGGRGPVKEAVDAVVGAPGAAARAVGGGVLDGLTRWMTDAARWVTSKIQVLIGRTTTPELEAAWYRERWEAMAALGVGLSVLVALIALTSAALRRDPDALGATLIGMFRAGIGTGLLLPLVALALGVADGITTWVATDASGGRASRFWGDVAAGWGAENHAGFGSSAIAFLFAVVQVIAGIAVWIEMQLRQAGIYVAVLFMPAALAAAIWPRLRAWEERLVALLFVMVSMKPVIVVVLSLAGSAAAAGGDADKDLGLLLSAVMILVLAAFVPWVLMLLVSIDSEGSWTALTASESVKGKVGGGLGRLNNTAAAGGGLGARRRAARLGGGSGDPHGRRSGGGGGGGDGSSGPNPDAGGGGSPGGWPAGDGPLPISGVAAAAGLLPPGGGRRNAAKKPAAGAQAAGGGAQPKDPPANPGDGGGGGAPVAPAPKPRPSAPGRRPPQGR